MCPALCWIQGTHLNKKGNFFPPRTWWENRLKEKNYTVDKVISIAIGPWERPWEITGVLAWLWRLGKAASWTEGCSPRRSWGWICRMMAVCQGKAGQSREVYEVEVIKEPRPRGNSLLVQWLRLHTPNAGVQSLFKELYLKCCNLRTSKAKWINKNK